MLEQRRAKEKGYITLREAAAIANYSPDYVGQLIRAGKIKGEQVYSGVAWVTTEDEIRAYLADKGRTLEAATSAQSVIQTDFTSHPLFKFLLYSVITFIALVLLVLQYILYVSIDTPLRDFFAATESSQNVDS